MSARILLVDDDASFVALMQLMLRSKGYEVLAAYSVPDALALLRTSAVDLVLLDMVIPGQDGSMLAQAVQADPALAQTPIVFLTALVSPVEAQLRAELGDQSIYLSKPVNPARLMACVEEQLARSRGGRSGAAAGATPLPPPLSA